MIEVEAFFDPVTHTVSYLIWDGETKDAIAIDSVWDFDPNAGQLSTKSVDKILNFIQVNELKLSWVLDTHAHADHLSAAAVIRKETGAKVGIGARISDVKNVFKPIFNAEDVKSCGQYFDGLFEDGDEIPFGHHTVKVMNTPGHTASCVTYLIGDMAFVGDTLFMPDYGTARTDFPGGNADMLYQSIHKILSLPEDTQIFVGHDYLPQGRTDYRWETTVAEQIAHNVHIGNGKSRSDFVSMRNARDATLNVPRLILPSLQVNIRAGQLPPKAADGHHYLAIPVNRI